MTCYFMVFYAQSVAILCYRFDGKEGQGGTRAERVVNPQFQTLDPKH